MGKLLSLSLGLLLVVGLTGSAQADVLRLSPASVTVVRSDENAVLFDVTWDIEGLRSGTNRSFQAATLEWRVAGLEAERRPEFSVQPTSLRPDAESDAWDLVDSETALDVEPVSDVRLERVGGYVRLDVLEYGWDAADGTTCRLSVLATGVDSESVARQTSALELVLRYQFLPEDVLRLYR